MKEIRIISVDLAKNVFLRLGDRRHVRDDSTDAFAVAPIVTKSMT